MGQRIEKVVEKAVSGNALRSGFFHTTFTAAPCIPPYSAAIHGDTRLIAARPRLLVGALPCSKALSRVPLFLSVH
ncbi:hypothetical protein J2W83_004068 [Pseudomonas hunanensis]|uniref:Uncharacterized protein n=1 Tax=Pseudomonas hunanensis TaxID=1247546 RepID=A0ACC6K7S1_9PSED|nr:hypothetical protein [Pseudomonas hunanensis]